MAPAMSALTLFLIASFPGFIFAILGFFRWPTDVVFQAYIILWSLLAAFEYAGSLT
jgi:hypothetical protein